MSAATAEVLRKARVLVERGWTQREPARDAVGNGRSAWMPDAVCWCVYGAIAAVEANHEAGDVVRVAFGAAIDGQEIGKWNDTPGRTQAEVLDAFDRAIAAEEATP